MAHLIVYGLRESFVLMGGNFEDLWISEKLKRETRND
jgi:hypothetical protein